MLELKRKPPFLTVRFCLVWSITMLTIWFRASRTLASMQLLQSADRMTPATDHRTFRSAVC